MIVLAITLIVEAMSFVHLVHIPALLVYPLQFLASLVLPLVLTKIPLILVLATMGSTILAHPLV